MDYQSDLYGTIDDTPVRRHRVMADSFAFSCIDYGCTITEIGLPDSAGNVNNVVLALDTLEDYMSHDYYLGCVVGRSAGRIEQAQFTLDGQTVYLPANDGVHHLHGDDFHKAVWVPSVDQSAEHVTIRFERAFPDGHHGYPGHVNVAVIYKIRPGAVTIRHEATTDTATVMNMTNHTYFNLSGTAAPIHDHTLRVASEAFYALDEALIPHHVQRVTDSPAFDFRQSKRIGDGLASDDEQLHIAGGFDHPFRLLRTDDPQIQLRHSSGRTLSVQTTDPCVVFYSGNMLPDDQKQTGLCLETQKAPNLIDREVVLRPGETYRTETTWTFTS
ncbi:aldose epimerase family protein [Exiguobacterium sp. ZOR0005]|uniref:aldose epimerase family protein n=1 Tax=Exiguobacterium sp. ZOR0005 TaxID=1339226 RepID=UPI000648C502|nr:aldose epimerase family protein [Exiguobacterium sp. ZOR0005]